jgi:raffinose/stachyose/melibiose transport system permease protein
MILSGVKIYNEYVFALYFLQSADRRMITTYVSSFFHEVSYINQASAAALLGALPIIVVYLVLQKWFIAGAMDSAVK